MPFISLITSVLIFASFPQSTSFPVNQTTVSGAHDNPLGDAVLNRTESLLLPDAYEKKEKATQYLEKEYLKKSHETVLENNETSGIGGEPNAHSPETGLSTDDSLPVTFLSPSQETFYIIDKDHRNVTDSNDDMPSMTLPRAYHDLIYSEESNETQPTFAHNKTLEDIVNRLYNETDGIGSSAEDGGYMFYEFRSPVDESNDFYDNSNSWEQGDITTISTYLKPSKDTELVGDHPHPLKQPTPKAELITSTPSYASNVLGTRTLSSTSTFHTKSNADAGKTAEAEFQLKPTPDTELPSSTIALVPTDVPSDLIGKLNASRPTVTSQNLPDITRTVTITASPTRLDNKNTVKELAPDTPAPPTAPVVEKNSSPPIAPLPPTPVSVLTESVTPPTLPGEIHATNTLTQSVSSMASSTLKTQQLPLDLQSASSSILPPILETYSTSVILPTPPTPPNHVTPPPEPPSVNPQTMPKLDLPTTPDHIDLPVIPTVPSTRSSYTMNAVQSASETNQTEGTIPKFPLPKPTNIIATSHLSVISTASSPTTTIATFVLPPAPVTEEPKPSTTQNSSPPTKSFSATLSSPSTFTSLPAKTEINKVTPTPPWLAPDSSKSLPTEFVKPTTSVSLQPAKATEVTSSTLLTSQNLLSSTTDLSRITPIIDLPKTLPSKTKPYDESGNKLTSYTPGGKPLVPTDKFFASLPTTTIRRSETKHHENAILPATDYPETTTPTRQIITKPGPPDSESNIIFSPTEINLPTSPESVPTKKPPFLATEVMDDTLPELYLTFRLKMTWPQFCGHRNQFKIFLLRLLQIDKQRQLQQFLPEIDFPYQIVFPGTYDKCKGSKPRIRRATDHLKIYVYVADYKGRYDEVMTQRLYNLVTTMNLNDAVLFDGVVENIKLRVLKPATAVTEPVPQMKTLFSPGIIIGICIGSLTVIFIILFIVLKTIAIRKRSRVKQMRYCENNSGARTPDETSSLAESIQLCGVHGRERFTYCNPNIVLKSFNTTNPSNILNKAGLAQMIFDDELVEQEFMLLPNTMPKLSEVPIGAEDKNRFANVIPTRPTKVYLDYIRGEEHSDYFNGNFVRGFDGNPKFYIATQAPLDSTRADFWRMIWEQRCQVVLMLTQLDENGLSKCTEYWPNTDHADKVRIYGDYEVILQRRQVKPYWIISTLILKDLERNLCREVHHIWFLVWPEQDLPPSPVVLSLLREVWDYTHDSESPIVVHCCPGTGRTGTLIAIDTCMRQYTHSGMVDILQCVYNLRHDRAGAVQTKQQYAFIYETLHDFAEYRSRTPSCASSVASGIHH